MDTPQAVDYGLFVGLCIALLAMAVSAGARLRSPIAAGAASPATGVFQWLPCGCVAAMAIALAALDQERIQPWFYQLILFSTVFTLATPARGLILLRWLVVGIYAYSAAGKLDYQFLHTVGQDFLDVLLSWCGIAPQSITRSSRLWLVGLFPIGELAIALMLALPPTRKLGGVLACLFHLGLVALFSPLGLGHSLGVLLWNIQFAVQAIVLFSWPLGPAEATQSQPVEFERVPTPEHFGTSLATCWVVVASLLPIFERIGFWDHWPSWAVYAPHSSRTDVFVATTAMDRLPPVLASLMRDNLKGGNQASEADESASPEQDAPGQRIETLWQPVPLSRWCLTTTGAPVYPQSRSGMAVALELMDVLDTRFEVSAEMRSTASRLNGQRTTTRLSDSQAIRRAANNFWMNTQPRRTNP